MANAHDEQEIMTLTEAAAFLRLNPRTLYTLAQRGEIPAQKLGNRWRFSRSVLLSWIKDGHVPTARGTEETDQ